MFPCVPFCRAVWWGIQLRWFCLHGFEYSCAEMGETNPKLRSEQRHIHSFAGLLKALSLRPTIQPTLSWASIKTFRQDTKEILEQQMSCDSHSLYHAECSISCCWPFQLMPSIFCFEDDQDQVRHRTEYCSRVSLNPSMAYCLWWQGPLVHLRPCLDSDGPGAYNEAFSLWKCWKCSAWFAPASICQPANSSIIFPISEFETAN